MTPNHDELRRRFLELRDPLVELQERLEAWLDSVAREVRAKEYHVSGRVKQLDSFLRKVMKKDYEDPFVEMSDKMGVRVDTLYLHDAEAICEAIRGGDAPEVVHEDVKIEELGPDKLGYLGVHFDVLPRDIPEGVPPDVAVCEVQVRTMAQGVWAMASHDLVYKLPKDLIPQEANRRVHRLMALIELFDEEVRRARDAIVNQATYPIARIIDTLEGEFVNFAAPSRDAELTRQIVSVLLELFGPGAIETLPEDLSEWVQQHEEKLRRLYGRYADDDRNPLLFQPEALLVFYLLDTGDRYRLELTWNESLPPSYLVSLATIWGDPI